MKTVYDQLYKILGEKFNNIFIPDDDFYGNWNSSDERLNQMANTIFRWLQLDSTIIEVKYDNSIKMAGLYRYNGNIRTILINSKYGKDPFYVGAILAHECMHFYLEKNDIGSKDVMTTELATDFGTIITGLSILTINGMFYKNYWHRTVLGMMIGMIYAKKYERLVGYLLPRDYCIIFTEYLKMRNFSGKDIIGYINPYARYYLPKPFSKEKAIKKLFIISEQERTKTRSFIREVLLIISIVIFGISFIATSCQNEKTTKAELKIIFADMMKPVLMLEKDLKKINMRLEGMEKDLSRYRAANDSDNVMKILPSYEKLLEETKNLSQEYNELGNRYNAEVAKVNKMKFYEMQKYVRKHIKSLKSEPSNKAKHTNP